MSTTIHSNGSHLAGEEPDTIMELLAVLQAYTLEPMFERNGDFIIDSDPVLPFKTVRFFGNFRYLSHVFSIDSDDPFVIATLTAAIRANQSTPAYQAARLAYIECQKREAARAEDNAKLARKRVADAAYRAAMAAP